MLLRANEINTLRLKCKSGRSWFGVDISSAARSQSIRSHGHINLNGELQPAQGSGAVTFGDSVKAFVGSDNTHYLERRSLNRTIEPMVGRRSAPPYKGPGADSEEKHEPASDIDTVVVDGLKALDPRRPIREADITRTSSNRRD